MPYFDKHFTLEEANALLPETQRRLRKMQDAHHRYQDAQAQILANATSRAWEQVELGLASLQSLLAEMTEQGILVKDLGRGLIDFPHWRDGEEVLLCYELSEDQILYWHDFEQGYSGRQPL